MSDEFPDRDPASGSVSREPEGGERTMENKPAAKKPAAKEQPEEPGDTGEVHLEEDYPGVTEQIRRFMEAELPSCPYCGSEKTASVQVGMTGRAKTIAEATMKVKLVSGAKDKLGEYFCNSCGKYFN